MILNDKKKNGLQKWICKDKFEKYEFANMLMKNKFIKIIEESFSMKGALMKIITISREFGSGGREVGKRLADVLGYDYYDKEIIAEISANKGVAEDYITRALENPDWKDMALTYNRSFFSVSLESTQVDLLLEQKRVIEEIAKEGRDCVIVGRNSDVILRDYNSFNMFICADMASKIKRCQARMAEGEKLSEKEIKRQINRIDKNRAQTRGILTSIPWGEKSAFHLTVNTADWDMQELANALAEFTRSWFARKNL